MVSNAKRMKYVSENDYSSSDGENVDDGDFSQHNRRMGGRRTKGLSRNAIMARENRLKKKIYITNLEKEVGHLKTENANYSKVIESQSLLIADLKKEIKYLKSVIANSADIGNLIKNIHHSTGMSVTTSLDQSLSLNVSKPKQAIARKTAHPWEEKRYPSFPTPESDFLSSPHSESGLNDFTDDLFNNIELDDFMGVTDTILDPVSNETSEENLHLKEHNYTTNEDEDDVGVCLHVSRHKVSLEFCATCSENAQQAWND
ncbi:uncharacterized protein LOC103315046 isoform X1 [Tribolium castaneum]|uniref:uncharacterized protein LOC103315046 isoform X1 n=1 Tax=Tribolium castaneum TaxID=7070 RepID=UPI0030FE37FC